MNTFRSGNRFKLGRGATPVVNRIAFFFSWDLHKLSAWRGWLECTVVSCCFFSDFVCQNQLRGPNRLGILPPVLPTKYSWWQRNCLVEVSLGPRTTRGFFLCRVWKVQEKWRGQAMGALTPFIGGLFRIWILCFPGYACAVCFRGVKALTASKDIERCVVSFWLCSDTLPRPFPLRDLNVSHFCPNIVSCQLDRLLFFKDHIQLLGS